MRINLARVAKWSFQKLSPPLTKFYVTPIATFERWVSDQQVDVRRMHLRDSTRIILWIEGCIDSRIAICRNAPLEMKMKMKMKIKIRPTGIRIMCVIPFFHTLRSRWPLAVRFLLPERHHCMIIPANNLSI